MKLMKYIYAAAAVLVLSPAVFAFTSPAEFYIDNDGQTTTQPVGATLTVSLPFVTGSGYFWNAASGDEKVLKTVSPWTVANGKQVFKFKVVGAGVAVVRAVYLRPLQENQPSSRPPWSITVTAVNNSPVLGKNMDKGGSDVSLWDDAARSVNDEKGNCWIYNEDDCKMFHCTWNDLAQKCS